jgi:hypothetical protein
VLVAIASGYELSDEASAAYREIARGIGSDHEYSRVMRALPRGERGASR